ncbi:MAG TPA: PVC-type heme-binding CxxCH protein [Candidatus Limnocylindria bacterium]|nr:PVC-type heme-binding CxxCH protein [Candidatus Limnocylindria bacterium]
MNSSLPRRHAFLRPLDGWIFLGLAFAAGLRAAGAPDPADPAVEQASFRVLDGFEVSLFASETNGVVKPIQIRFDPDGRLWISGSVTYPQIKPGEPSNDSIVVLEDGDGDGRADRTTVFADGLMIPSGLELGDGGVYVGSGTELLHLRDTDGDGRADERRVVFQGFGTGDTHQTINSFTWGPSGELLLSQGLHAISRIETPWGVEELRQAGVWRFWPRRLRLDPFWNGAMGAHNPFGNVFDRWGQPFVFAGNGHGVYFLTPAMIRTDHFLEQKSLWNQGRKFGGGDFVENSHWPATNRHEVITGGYLQNTVERFRITDDGAGFKAERLAPLIESTNTAFRIVDARFGPDGALYLCDWYNPVIGHYQASFRHPDRDKAHGRIWRVTAKGSAPVKWQKLSGLPTPQLLDLLKSPERWNRQMAKRALADRPTKEVTEALAAWLSPAHGTLDDLTLCEALGVYASHEVVEPALLTRVATATTPEARAYAAHVLGHWADRWPKPLELLARLAADPHPRVRLEAVVACSYVADAHAVEVAAIAADQPFDPFLEYAFTQCVQALKPLWRDANARGELTFGGVSARQTAFARADQSADTVEKAAGRLRRIAEVALDADTQRSLLQVVAESGGPRDLGVLLSPRAFSFGAQYDTTLHARILNELGALERRRHVRPEGDLVAALRPLLGSVIPEIRAEALRLVGAWHLEDDRADVLRFARDAAEPLVVRRAAIDALGGLQAESDRAELFRLAGPGEPAAVRAAAIRQLAGLTPTTAAPAAAALLAEPLDEAATTEVLSAFLQQKDGVTALRAALLVRPPSAGAAKVALQLMAGSGRREPQLAELFTQAAGLGRGAQPAKRADLPALLREVREHGDAQRGAAIFQRPELNCGACHAIAGAGGKVGPDLGALGTAQTAEFILGAILEPQKEVKEGFMAFELVTKDGESHQGYIRNETADEVVLFDPLGQQTVRLRRDQIAERHQHGSLMPDGLADTLGREELRDLVKYLSQLGRK